MLKLLRLPWTPITGHNLGKANCLRSVITIITIFIITMNSNMLLELQCTAKVFFVGQQVFHITGPLSGEPAAGHESGQEELPVLRGGSVRRGAG